MSVSDHASPVCWRYGSPEMRKLFLEDRKLQYRLDVEAALAVAEAGVGLFGQEFADEISNKANTNYIKPEDVWDREQKIKHDVMAMVEILTEACSGEAGKYVHLGATSYDIDDNTLALQMKAASLIIIERTKKYGRNLLEKAYQYKDLPAVGRTHGQWAEPITFGHKFARYAYDAYIDLQLWQDFLDKYLVGKPMTGAVGTADSYKHLTGDGDKADEIGRRVMETLRLSPALITDQAITRKMHALAGSYMQQAASSAERFAWEVWHLQRPEIGEMWERSYLTGDVSSSAMPHKRNPINCENIIALSRVVKNLARTGYDNIALLHETELTKSGSERIWMPTSFILLDEILERGAKIAKISIVRENNVKRNLEKATPLTACEPLMMELVKKGLGRQDAHKLLRDYAQRLYENPGANPFDILSVIPEISSHLERGDIQKIFDGHVHYTGNSSKYVQRVIDELGPAFSE